MKEYKVISVIGGMLVNAANDLEKRLNSLAKQGWSVKTSLNVKNGSSDVYSCLVILERNAG